MEHAQPTGYYKENISLCKLLTRVQYIFRSFCQDKVIVLEKDSNIDAVVPLEPIELHVRSLPEPTEDRPSGGMYLLQRFPSRPIQPGPFLAGSSKYLQDTMSAIRREYGVTNPQWVTAWEDWLVGAPQSDNSQEYIKANPDKYHIPFRDLLFGGLDINSDNAVLPMAQKTRDFNIKKPKFCQMEAAACVQWKGNGGSSHLVEPFRPLGSDDVSSTLSRVKKTKQDQW